MRFDKKTFVQVFGVLVILISAFGFIFKLVEFSLSLTRGDVINFAVVPVTVYLIVAAGFFALFLWSIARGHLKDVEHPKYRILEQEEEYRKRGI